MFEVKDTGSEVQMIGTFVDVYEFADRWNKFSTFQKAVLKSCSYIGTNDDFSLSLGYSAPMATMYRKQMNELVELGLIQIADFNREFYEEHKQDFDDYDFLKTKKFRRTTKMFLIPNPTDVANRILDVSKDKLPDHSLFGPLERKGNDYRAYANEKRRKPNFMKNYTHKLSKEDKESIRQEYLRGKTTYEKIAVKYNVTKQTICNVVKG